MAPSRSVMVHIRWADTQPAASPSPQLRRGGRQKRGIGFRYAQTAPPYGLRWASLQPTPLSCREERHKTRKRGEKIHPLFDELNEPCNELRPTRVLQKA